MGEGEGTIAHALKGVKMRFEVEGRKGEYSSGSGGKSAQGAWSALFAKFSHKM